MPKRKRRCVVRAEWLALADLTQSEWWEVGWRIKQRRIRHRDLARVRAVIREVKKDPTTWNSN